MIEREHSIPQRWTPDSPSYQAVDRLQIQQSKQDAFARLKQCARERWFLLTIKAKYAGTCVVHIFMSFTLHSIIYQMVNIIMVSQISRGIQQELKRLLNAYNQLVSEHLSWKDVTDLSSSIWNPSEGNSILPPRSVRLVAINAYVLKSLGLLKKRN